MITIIWIYHATTEENKTSVASGHSRVRLAPEGIEQANKLHDILKDMHFDAAYTSDLPRCVETAQIALKGYGIEIIEDTRLREIDYGDYTGKPRSEVRDLRLAHVHTPLPNGESYDEVLAHYASLLSELRQKHDGQTVVLCGHSPYPLEVLIENIPVEEALFDVVDEPYRTFSLS